MFGYIYKTTNLINNKIYIGKKHSNVFIEDYFGSGKLIKLAIDKYGVENFKVELIDVANSLEEINEKEKHHISDNNSYYKYGKGYNISSGGGGYLLYGADLETISKFKEKCRLNSIGKRNPNYGNGEKISGDKNPAKRIDVRKKLSKSLSGKNNPMYGCVQTKEQIQNRINKTRENNNGKFPNQFTNNPNAKHWRDKKYYLYDNDRKLMEFKNKISLINYCKNNLGFSKKMILDCLESNISIKDVSLYKGSRSYKINNEAKIKYPNYNFKTEDTEVN